MNLKELLAFSRFLCRLCDLDYIWSSLINFKYY